YADKRLLFRNARADNVWILNGDDALVLELAHGVPGRRVLFSLVKPADAWYDAPAHLLRLGGEALLEREELHLLGDHNVANALAAQPGDAVLLSPACSSYDMFKNYEQRGATFRRIVEAL